MVLTQPPSRLAVSLGTIASLLLFTACAACAGCGGRSIETNAGPSDSRTETTSTSTDAGGDAGCVDVTIGAADISCAVSRDCTFVSSLEVCPGDPSCGLETPVNLAGAARYAAATASVPLTPVSCGAPAPVGCVNQVCAIVAW